MSILGTNERPLRVAIVGSGPSGFYSAESLLKSSISLKIDMFEKFPAPFGLVRFGVAPDHDKIKKVIKVFEGIAKHPNFSFIGNVTVGEHISVKELQQYYDAVILAYGAESDRQLNIPGEGLPESYTATQFVAWYNGHPDFQDLKFDLSHEVAVIMGQGNVAIDVARILCKTTEELKKTDITAQALEVLSKSKVKEVHMYGRRGPLQAAFTLHELKEMGELADCYPVVDPQELALNETGAAEIELPANAHFKRNYDVLRDFLKIESAGRSRKFFIHFFRTPAEILGQVHVEGVRFEKNEPVGDFALQKPKGTGHFEQIDCGVFFRSVGYTGTPIAGLPFSIQRGVIPSEAGRIVDDGKVLQGLYVAGWIKTGAVGSIGANKPGAQEAVDSLLHDVTQLKPCTTPNTDDVLNLLKTRGAQVVTFLDWKKIDLFETSEGAKLGKPREKITHVKKMISVIDL